MKNGEFPDPLKLGNIDPVFKKDNEELKKNDRRVSTLPIFGKIFEKGILHNKQFGFRKNRTTQALNYSISQIKNSLNKTI